MFCFDQGVNFDQNSIRFNVKYRKIGVSSKKILNILIFYFFIIVKMDIGLISVHPLGIFHSMWQFKCFQALISAEKGIF